MTELVGFLLSQNTEGHFGRVLIRAGRPAVFGFVDDRVAAAAQKKAGAGDHETGSGRTAESGELHKVESSWVRN